MRISNQLGSSFDLRPKLLIIPFLVLPLSAGIGLDTPVLAAVNFTYVDVGNGGNANEATGYVAVPNAYKIAQNETILPLYAKFGIASDRMFPLRIKSPKGQILLKRISYFR